MSQRKGNLLSPTTAFSPLGAILTTCESLTSLLICSPVHSIHATFEAKHYRPAADVGIARDASQTHVSIGWLVPKQM